MRSWNEVKNEIKSISEEKKKAIEILAELEIDYDEEKIERIVKIISG